MRRWLGASTLAVLVALSVSGCSGSQQDDDGLDASDNQAAENNDAGGDNNAASADDNNNGGGDANVASADDNASGGGDSTADSGSDSSGSDSATADSGSDSSGGTDNDLQDIITEMNGQNGSGGDGSASADGSQGGSALPQNAQANGAAPANSQAAAPAAAAAPTNNAAMAANGSNNGNTAAPAPAPAAGEQAQAAPQSTSLPFQPGGSPAAQGLPELGSKMAYIVEKGDTLAKISQKIYGTNGRWQELATLSGIANPSRIFPGDLVYYSLDESAVAFAKAYDSVQRSEEQVRPGDTLATIAQRLYGTSAAWRSIWRHNDRIDNPDIVTPGTTVYYVPKGALQAAVHKAKADLVKIAAIHTHKLAKHALAKELTSAAHSLSRAQRAHSELARNLVIGGCSHLAGGQFFHSFVTMISNT